MPGNPVDDDANPARGEWPSRCSRFRGQSGIPGVPKTTPHWLKSWHYDKLACKLGAAALRHGFKPGSAICTCVHGDVYIITYTYTYALTCLFVLIYSEGRVSLSVVPMCMYACIVL